MTFEVGDIFRVKNDNMFKYKVIEARPDGFCKVEYVFLLSGEPEWHSLKGWHPFNFETFEIIEKAFQIEEYNPAQAGDKEDDL